MVKNEGIRPKTMDLGLQQYLVHSDAAIQLGLLAAQARVDLLKSPQEEIIELAKQSLKHLVIMFDLYSKLELAYKKNDEEKIVTLREEIERNHHIANRYGIITVLDRKIELQINIFVQDVDKRAASLTEAKVYMLRDMITQLDVLKEILPANEFEATKSELRASVPELFAELGLTEVDSNK